MHLIDLNGFIQSHHHIIPDDAEWEEGAVKAPYVLNALGLAGRNDP